MLKSCSKAFDASKNPSYAHIEDLKSIQYSDPLTVYQGQYWRGNVGLKSSKREILINEAASLKNITGRMLSFFVASCRMGYSGTIAPLDVISENLVRTTGGKGEPRTVRRALNALEGLGWIHKARKMTNAFIMLGSRKFGLSVLKITFTNKIFQLLDLMPVCDTKLHRPKRPPLLKPEAGKQETIGRSLASPAVTSLTEKKKERQLAPLRSAQTSPLQETIGTELASLRSAQASNQEQLGAVPAPYASITCESQATKTEKQKQCRSCSKFGFKNGTSQEFFTAFIGAFQAFLFAQKDENSEKLLTIASNQLSPLYPKNFPKVPFDLMVWANSTWDEQRKLLKEYSKKISDFHLTIEEKTQQTKKIFLTHGRGNVSFSVFVGCLVVSGKMNIGEVAGNVLADFPA